MADARAMVTDTKLDVVRPTTALLTDTRLPDEGTYTTVPYVTVVTRRRPRASTPPEDTPPS